MTTTYKTITTEHLGPDATEADLAEFVSICEAAHELYPNLSDDELTDKVFGDGDYPANARKMGVDVDAILAE